MKCLVTGGAGFIGSNLVDALVDRSVDVVCVDNESATSNAKFYWNDAAKNYVEDITDHGAMVQLFDCERPTHVFHLAAEARIQPTISDPPKSLYTNVGGTANLLKVCDEFSVKRFLLSSTSAVYGLRNSPPFNEDMSRQCLNPYSIGKAASEDLCKFYHKVNGMETIVFRYFNVYGERQPIKGQYAPVIGLFMEQRKNNRSLTVIGKGTQTRDFTHVSDVVAANMLASTTCNPAAYGEVFNVGTGESISISDLADIYGGKKMFTPPRAAELEHARADITKIKKILGWTPKINLQQWINGNNI